MRTGAQPDEDHTLCALDAHTHREDTPLINTEQCGFPPRVSLGTRLPSFTSHGPQQVTKDPHPHSWQSSVQCSLSKILSAFHQVALFSFPLFLLICGELSNFFTVGGNKSQTVSDYLKNKTTHTKQNKTLCCQLLRDSEQLPAQRQFSQPPVPTILSQSLESMCGSAHSFHVAGQKGPGSGEVGTQSWKASEAPGFESPGPNYSQQNRG